MVFDSILMISDSIMMNDALARQNRNDADGLGDGGWTDLVIERRRTKSERSITPLVAEGKK
jgi:hypothetical protein